jgi:molybdenum cofactor cytidylyltransferase
MNDFDSFLDPTDFDGDDCGRGGSTGGVLLAAGSATRYDEGNKLLEPIDGEPIVRRAARTLLDTDFDDMVVVVGHKSDDVKDALDGLAIDFMENPEYDDGLSTSVHRGVEISQERGWDAVVFGLGDMPFVQPESVDLLVRADATTNYTIFAAAYDQKRGNPTLFDAVHYDALAEIGGDTGGRPLMIGSDEMALVETDDPGVVRDIDTVEDYEQHR